MTEALSRLHGELLAVGLDVKIIERPPSTGRGPADSSTWLERVVAENRLDAVIELLGDVAPVEVDVWVVEKSSQDLELSRVPLDTDASNASERLAIRAVEVLRSTFLEKEMVGHRQPESERTPETTPQEKPEIHRPAAATQKSKVAQPRLEPSQSTHAQEHFSVEAGAAVLASFAGVGPAVLPIARTSWAPTPGLAIQLTAAGFGTRPNVETSIGTARASQRFVTLGSCYRLRTNRWLWPFMAISAGVLHTAFAGEAESPLHGRTLAQWSFLLEGSVGIGLRFLERYYSTLSMHAQLAEPYLAVHFVDRVVAKTGRPNLLLSLTVGTWL